MDNSEALIIKRPGYYQRISKYDILFIKKDYRKVVVELENSTVSFYSDKSFLSKIKFRDFFKVHNALVVNLESIVKMRGGYIYFRGGKALKIGVSNFRKLLKELD